VKCSVGFFLTETALKFGKHRQTYFDCKYRSYLKLLKSSKICDLTWTWQFVILENNIFCFFYYVTDLSRQLGLLNGMASQLPNNNYAHIKSGRKWLKIMLLLHSNQWSTLSVELCLEEIWVNITLRKYLNRHRCVGGLLHMCKYLTKFFLLKNFFCHYHVLSIASNLNHKNIDHENIH